jgi:hypothetical protein
LGRSLVASENKFSKCVGTLYFWHSPEFDIIRVLILPTSEDLVTLFIPAKKYTGDAKPVRIPARKVPLTFANEEKKVIDQMHQQGIIQKSNSPWSSVRSSVILLLPLFPFHSWDVL